jgi:hypothetical protein
MHNLNVLILGPMYFVSTLVELKKFLKFNLYKDISHLDSNNGKFDAVIIHQDFQTSKQIDFDFKDNALIKILATNKVYKDENYNGTLKLPTTLGDINFIIENSTAKKIFNKNSSIRIKDYYLDKNQKKLSKKDDYVILTEKEIQLLELLLSYTKPISKKKILASVWDYSSEADTHTVETHIYRLRKKISDKFIDERFIINNKDGYSF